MFTLDARQVDLLLTLLASMTDEDVHQITEGDVDPDDAQGLFDDLHDAWEAATGIEHPEQCHDDAQTVDVLMTLGRMPDGTYVFFETPVGGMGIIHPQVRTIQ